MAESVWTRWAGHLWDKFVTLEQLHFCSRTSRNCRWSSNFRTMLHDKRLGCVERQLPRCQKNTECGHCKHGESIQKHVKPLGSIRKHLKAFDASGEHIREKAFQSIGQHLKSCMWGHSKPLESIQRHLRAFEAIRKHSKAFKKHSERVESIRKHFKSSETI